MANVKHAGRDRTQSDLPDAHDAPDALHRPDAVFFLLMFKVMFHPKYLLPLFIIALIVIRYLYLTKYLWLYLRKGDDLNVMMCKDTL